MPGLSFVEGVGLLSMDCSALTADRGVTDALRVSYGDKADEDCRLGSL